MHLMQAQVHNVSKFTLFTPELDKAQPHKSLSHVKPKELASCDLHDHGAAPLPKGVKMNPGEWE
jgi:hypothetical protein